MNETQRVYAEIDIDAIRHNLNEIKRLEGNRAAGLCAVLKADAYGHGATPIARALEKEDVVTAYAVATADEAVALRVEAGVEKPVMILGYAFPESDEALFRHRISPSVFREDTARSLEETAKRLKLTNAEKLPVHIPVDTGMGRIGVTPDDDGLQFVRRVLQSDALFVEGLFTHFATADEADGAFCARQIALFRSFVDRVKEELHFSPPCVHADNSAAILSGRGDALSMARAGIAMYGLYPSPYIAANGLLAGRLRPALSFYSHLSFVKEVPAGFPVSYGRTFTTTRPSKIATVPIGYADGYPRALSNKAHVLIKGRKAPVAGRICMDQFMVDVTDIPFVKAGDLVTLIGADGAETIGADELGELSDRFHYEFVCCINKRVPRIYKNA